MAARAWPVHVRRHHTNGRPGKLLLHAQISHVLGSLDQFHHQGSIRGHHTEMREWTESLDEALPFLFSPGRRQLVAAVQPSQWTDKEEAFPILGFKRVPTLFFQIREGLVRPCFLLKGYLLEDLVQGDVVFLASTRMSHRDAVCPIGYGEPGHTRKVCREKPFDDISVLKNALPEERGQFRL